MSRGSSILAGLILIGTLSALAIVLDNSAAVRVARSVDTQTAATLAALPPPDAKVKPPPPVTATTVKDTKAPEDIRQCEPNFNYKVLVDPKSKTTKVVCTIPLGDIPETGGKPLAFRCPGDLKGCDNAEEKHIKDYAARKPYTECASFPCEGWDKARWESHCSAPSQLKLCTPPDLKKAAEKDAPDDKSCVFSSCKATDKDKGVVSKAKQGAAKNLPSLLKDTKDKDTLEALNPTQGLLKADKTTSDILLKGLKEEEDIVGGELVKARRDLDALKDLEGSPNEEDQRKLEAAKARVKELEEQKARLASAAKQIESKDGPPGKQPPGKDGPGTDGPGNRGPGDQRGPFSGKDGNTFPKLPMMPMMPGGSKGGQGQGQGQNPQQCYNYQQYSAQNNAYCSNGSIYAYNSQTCQYQVQLQCPSGQCNTQNLTNDMYGRQISTQCAPTSPTNTQTTAQLSCNPRRVDLGSPTTITYSCSQGTATGNGFTATGSSGSATVTPEKPPRGSTSITYGLTCTGAQGQTSQATPCQVEVNVPLIVIVASPQEVESGKYTTLGWVTRGMKSCTVQSLGNHGPWNTEQAKNTSVSGTVKSPDLTQETIFELSCKTQDDKDKKSTVTVRIK